MRNKTQSGRLARKAYLFLLPSLAGTAVFVLLPYVDVVRRSFFEAAGGRFVAMQNYVTVVGNSAFRLASFNTLRFLVICVPLLVLVSLFCSMLIAGLKEEGTVFKTSLLVPLAIPVASIVLLWKLFFHPQGMVNQITALFGMAGIDWINGDTAFGVLVFTYVWKNLGYDVVLWVAGLAAISDELYEAARVDGANGVQVFRYITVPQLKPTIIFSMIYATITYLRSFALVEILTEGGPYRSTETIIMYMFKQGFQSRNVGYASVIAVVVFLITLVISLIQMKLTKYYDD